MQSDDGMAWRPIFYKVNIFKENQIPKKVLRGAKSPLNICKKNTQNTFLKHLQCVRSCAIFVIHMKTYIIKLIYDTNIQFKKYNRKQTPKNQRIILKMK